MIAVAGLVLVLAGTAFAASGVGTLVTAGDDGAATARGAQQPLGALSATPPAPVAPPGGGNPDTGRGGSAGDGGNGGGGNGGGGTKGDDGDGGANGDGVGGDRRLGSTNRGGEPVSNVAGAGDSLPFTGFLAIPVLLAGAALLISGMVLRRRSSAPSGS